ncbi:MAG: hypothetical protein ACR2RF_24820 [Geminicoccaceae bacterium]
MNMATSKSIWVGLAMIAAGFVALLLPEAGSAIGVTGDPTQMIGTGIGIITLRLGIAKNGKEV